MEDIYCSLCWESGNIKTKRSVGDYDFFVCKTCLDLGCYYAMQQNAMAEQGIIIYSGNKAEFILEMSEREFDEFLIQLKTTRK